MDRGEGRGSKEGWLITVDTSFWDIITLGCYYLLTLLVLFFLSFLQGAHRGDLGIPLVASEATNPFFFLVKRRNVLFLFSLLFYSWCKDHGPKKVGLNTSQPHTRYLTSTPTPTLCLFYQLT